VVKGTNGFTPGGPLLLSTRLKWMPANPDFNLNPSPNEILLVVNKGKCPAGNVPGRGEITVSNYVITLCGLCISRRRGVVSVAMAIVTSLSTSLSTSLMT